MLVQKWKASSASLTTTKFLLKKSFNRISMRLEKEFHKATLCCLSKIQPNLILLVPNSEFTICPLHGNRSGRDNFFRSRFVWYDEGIAGRSSDEEVLLRFLQQNSTAVFLPPGKIGG